MDTRKIIFTCDKCGEDIEPWISHLLAMKCPLCYKDFRTEAGAIRMRRE